MKNKKTNNKMLFKNHTKYTKQVYNKFMKFHNDKFGIIYDIYTLTILILLLYCLIVSIKSNLFVLSITFVISILGFIYYRIFEPLHLIKKQMKSKTISQQHEIIFYFYENSFKIKENTKFDRLRYWQLHRIYETDDFFYLYLNKKYALIVSKNGFSLGTVEDFSTFVKKKMKFKYKSACNYKS